MDLSHREPVDAVEPAPAASAQGNGAGTLQPVVEPEPPVDSALLFQDWTIKRAERRVRRLFVALVLLAVVAGTGLFLLQQRLNEVSAVVEGGQVQSASPSRGDSSDDSLQRALFGTAGPGDKSDVIGSLEQRLASVEESIAELEESIAAVEGGGDGRLARCLNQQLRELDLNLRRLLQREISAERYVSGPFPRRCR